MINVAKNGKAGMSAEAIRKLKLYVASAYFAGMGPLRTTNPYPEVQLSVGAIREVCEAHDEAVRLLLRVADGHWFSLLDDINAWCDKNKAQGLSMNLDEEAKRWAGQ